MSDRHATEAPRLGRPLASLLIAAFGIAAVAAFSLPMLSTVSVGLSLVSAVYLARFERERRRLARHSVRDQGGSGRIVKQSIPRGVSFDLPADGLEPWGADAWVIGVVTLAAWAVLDSANLSVVFGFLALLLVAVAARLWLARYDRIHIELREEGFLVESVEGGRRIRCASPGLLLPELQTDALGLVSSTGRIGVLRGELQPEERAWLADHLVAFAKNGQQEQSDAGSLNRPEGEGSGIESPPPSVE